jgi:hypothetical protein
MNKSSRKGSSLVGNSAFDLSGHNEQGDSGQPHTLPASDCRERHWNELAFVKWSCRKFSSPRQELSSFIIGIAISLSGKPT